MEPPYRQITDRQSHMQVVEHGAMANDEGFFARGLFLCLVSYGSVVIEIGPAFDMVERQMRINF